MHSRPCILEQTFHCIEHMRACFRYGLRLCNQRQPNGQSDYLNSQSDNSNTGLKTNSNQWKLDKTNWSASTDIPTSCIRLCSSLGRSTGTLHLQVVVVVKVVTCIDEEEEEEKVRMEEEKEVEGTTQE